MFGGMYFRTTSALLASITMVWVVLIGLPIGLALEVKVEAACRNAGLTADIGDREIGIGPRIQKPDRRILDLLPRAFASALPAPGGRGPAGSDRPRASASLKR